MFATKPRLSPAQAADWARRLAGAGAKIAVVDRDAVANEFAGLPLAVDGAVRPPPR